MEGRDWAEIPEQSERAEGIGIKWEREKKVILSHSPLKTVWSIPPPLCANSHP